MSRFRGLGAAGSARATSTRRARRRVAAPALAGALAVGLLATLLLRAQPADAQLPQLAAARPPVAQHLAPAARRAAANRAVAADDGAGVLALNWGDLDATPGAWKGNYIVMQPWEYARIPAYRAKNPDVKILMYKDVSATRYQACSDTACTVDDAILPTGVGYHWAMAHHPDWFLRDSGGRPIEWSDWRGLYAMDVANPRYQRRWAANVLAELQAHDWDGVMLDDTLTSLSHPTVGNRVPATVPDDATQYADTTGFLRRVGPQLQASGYAAVANVGFQWDDWKKILTDWTPYVSGWENEYFVKWGLDDTQGRFTGADWTWKMRLSAWCAHRDVPLLAVTYSTSADRSAQVYHRATWLLTWNGHTGSSIFVPAEDHADHWMSLPTVDLGQPAGRRSLDRGTGVWSRAYDHGLVLVNPTERAVTVPLTSSYRTPGGRTVSQVRLGPTGGALLLQG